MNKQIQDCFENKYVLIILERINRFEECSEKNKWIQYCPKNSNHFETNKQIFIMALEIKKYIPIV